MKIGLLWYDDNPAHDLDEKISRAAQRHKRKFGVMPDLCYVHPRAIGDDGPRKVSGVRVAALPTVLRHHFWIGREVE